MRKLSVFGMCAGVLGLVVADSFAQPVGRVIAWGYNGSGQTEVPTDPLAIAIGAGDDHSLAVRPNGTVIAWGANYFGQTSVPAGLSNVVAVAGGYAHSIALKSDGTVAVWGLGSDGQTNVPAGLSGVVAIASGGYFNLALKGDGTVAAWGYSGIETIVPFGLSGVVAIVAAAEHSLALKADGHVVAWGADGVGTVPAGLSNVVAVAAGGRHNLALKADGTLTAWGLDPAYYEVGVSPTTVPRGLSNLVAIAAGGAHNLALKADGTIVSWGYSSGTNVPRWLSNVVTMAGGGQHSLALVPAQPPGIVVIARSQWLTTLEDTELALALKGTTSTGHALAAKVTHLPSGGTLYQYENGRRGARIATAPANVTDVALRLVYEPLANYYGADRFQFSVSDGAVESFPSFVAVNVLPVNDAPSFVKGPDQIVNQDSGRQVVRNWATNLNPGAANETNQMLTFLVIGNDNPALFSRPPRFSASSFDYTPATNTYGTARITIVLKDNGGTASGGQDTSPAQTFLITVLPAQPQIQQISLSNGMARLAFIARLGEVYQIQVSTNLADWVTLTSGSPDTSGVLEVNDPEAGSHPARFYRITGP